MRNEAGKKNAFFGHRYKMSCFLRRNIQEALTAERSQLSARVSELEALLRQAEEEKDASRRALQVRVCVYVCVRGEIPFNKVGIFVSRRVGGSKLYIYIYIYFFWFFAPHLRR